MSNRSLWISNPKRISAGCQLLLWSFIALGLQGTACQPPIDELTIILEADGGRRDADHGHTDSGQTDSGQTDSGQTDSGQTDSGQTDSGESGSHEIDGGADVAPQTDRGVPCRADLPCYAGPAGTEGVGGCRPGRIECRADGTERCVDELRPSPEQCDGLDNDCDGEADEALGQTECGQGVCRRTVPVCQEGQPRSCVPGEPTPERCDGLDNDCDGQADEGCSCRPDQWIARPTHCGEGVCRAAGLLECADGQVVDTCRAGAPQAAADERCDGLDEDCDGRVDEEVRRQPSRCGIGGCAAQGWVVCEQGRLFDSCQPGMPQVEQCNGQDDDCDGSIDEQLIAPPAQFHLGVCRGLVQRCLGAAGWVEPDYAAVPGHEPNEVTFDGLDNDCDGATDEGLALPERRTLILQPGPAQGQDIWTTSEQSYAADGVAGPGGGLDDGFLRIGGAGDEYRSLVRFELAGLPLQVEAVELRLFPANAPEGQRFTGLYLDRIDEPWDWRIQGTGRDRQRLWWADRPAATPWQAAPLPPPVPGRWYSIDLTELYRQWQSGAVPNHGIQLRPEATDDRFTLFVSSDHPERPRLRPQLVIVTRQPRPVCAEGEVLLAADRCALTDAACPGHAEGLPCEDGDPCTTEDRCQAEACVGQAVPDCIRPCQATADCTPTEACVAGRCWPAGEPSIVEFTDDVVVLPEEVRVAELDPADACAQLWLEADAAETALPLLEVGQILVRADGPPCEITRLEPAVNQLVLGVLVYGRIARDLIGWALKDLHVRREQPVRLRLPLPAPALELNGAVLAVEQVAVVVEGVIRVILDRSNWRWREFRTDFAGTVQVEFEFSATVDWEQELFDSGNRHLGDQLIGEIPAGIPIAFYLGADLRATLAAEAAAQLGLRLTHAREYGALGVRYTDAAHWDLLHDVRRTATVPELRASSFLAIRSTVELIPYFDVRLAQLAGPSFKVIPSLRLGVRVPPPPDRPHAYAQACVGAQATLRARLLHLLDEEVNLWQDRELVCLEERSWEQQLCDHGPCCDTSVEPHRFRTAAETCEALEHGFDCTFEGCEGIALFRTVDRFCSGERAECDGEVRTSVVRVPCSGMRCIEDVGCQADPRCLVRCGDGRCEAEQEDCANCPRDCGACCGNGVCEPARQETCATCEEDCGECCGDGLCSAAQAEDCATCEEDCGDCCGDGHCHAAQAENCATCAADCGACCGDGSCEPAHQEDCLSCVPDCGCPAGESCDPLLRVCGCVPACAGRTCGPDGCGGTCGACPAGASCSAQGSCVFCSCAGRPCGADDGCGQLCPGDCPDGQVCQQGQCLDPCTGECARLRAAGYFPTDAGFPRFACVFCNFQGLALHQMARYDLVIVQPPTWETVAREQGLTQAELARALRRLNPRLRILAELPGTYVHINESAGLAESALVHDTLGRRIEEWEDTNYPINFCDPTTPEILAQFTQARYNALPQGVYDGGFFDGVMAAFNYYYNKAIHDGYQPDLDRDGRADTLDWINQQCNQGQGYAAGLRRYLEQLRAALPPGAFLLANAAHTYEGTSLFAPILNATLDEASLVCTLQRTDELCGTTWRPTLPDLLDLMNGWREAAAEFPREQVVCMAQPTQRVDARWRLGLAMALFTEAHYLADLGTVEHGEHLDTYWFPEFDLAGTRLAWLGLPLGELREQGGNERPDLVAGGGFDNGLGPWRTWVNEAAGFAATFATGAAPASPVGAGHLRVHLDQVPAGAFDDWHVQLFHPGLTVRRGQVYTVRLQARASSARRISFLLQQGCEALPCDFAFYSDFRTLLVGTTWQSYTIQLGPVVIPQGDAQRGDARLLLNLASPPGTLEVDDLHLWEGSPQQLWIRDFEHGQVVANPETTLELRYTVPAGLRSAPGNPPGAVGQGPFDARLEAQDAAFFVR